MPTGHDGALAHLTVCVKDTIDVAGLPSTGGTTFPAATAIADATIVSRLRGAGAAILGKGHTNEFAYGIDGVNEMIGPAHNPHDRDRIAGGSSSGPAVALAACEADLGLGTDTSGSLRVPAALCGVVSLRPTHGALPMDGVMALAPSFDVPGPMARTVAVLAIAWSVLAARPPSDGAPVGSVAVLRSIVDGVDAGVAASVDATVAVLRDLGLTVGEIDDGLVPRAEAIHRSIQFPEAAVSIVALAPKRWRELPQALVERIEAGFDISAETYLRSQELRAALRADVLALLEEHDVLMGPAVPVPAPRLDATSIDLPDGPMPLRRALMARALPFSQAGVPVLTLPNGTVDGLPVGIQLAGRSGEEDRLLDLGRRMEAVL